MEQIISYIEQLFSSFGWWTLAVVGTSFLIMIPINLAIKAIFKKVSGTTVDRIRKTIAQICVFGVSAGVITIFALIIPTELSAGFVFTNCVPCGALAMIVWAIVKLIRDTGFAPLISYLAQNKEIKNLLKEIPIDQDAIKVVYDKLCNLVKNTDGTNAEIVVNKANEIVARAKEMLNGFADVTSIADASQKLLQALKLKFN